MKPEPYDFYGGPLSNFAYSPIEVDVGWGTNTYPTVEHAFQAAKATKGWQHHGIRKTSNPSLAKNMGRHIPLRPDWEEVKYEIMLTCLRAKFKLPYYKRELLATGYRELREDSPTDFVWGYRNGGQNLLGKALMQVREELRS